jgi:hypothetical protein
MADPAPEDRVWYRHAREGNRGYMVERDGKKYIHLDRPNEVIEQPFRESDWQVDRETRPLNKHQVGRIAYEADSVAREALGEYEPRKEWLSLTDAQRLAWMAGGPPPGPRKELFDMVMRWSRKYTVG